MEDVYNALGAMYYILQIFHANYIKSLVTFSRSFQAFSFTCSIIEGRGRYVRIYIYRCKYVCA